MVALNQPHNVPSLKCVQDSVYQMSVDILVLDLQLITFFSGKEVQI